MSTVTAPAVEGIRLSTARDRVDLPQPLSPPTPSVSPLRISKLPPSTALVGFTLPNGDVPTEGAVVLGEDGSPAGQVTSSRHSPVLDRTIGMAWVPAALAHDGAKITISDVGRQLAAEIQTRPFYDPDGEVLRS